MRIVAYAYAAGLVCPECIGKALTPNGSNSVSSLPVEVMLDGLAHTLGIDRDDETSFDSGAFPKVVFRDQLERGQQCGRCRGEL